MLSTLLTGHTITSTPPQGSTIDTINAKVWDEQWDEWLPTFERTVAGMMKKRMPKTFAKAKMARKKRLQVGRTMAAQDFRYAIQRISKISELLEELMAVNQWGKRQALFYSTLNCKRA